MRLPRTRTSALVIGLLATASAGCALLANLSDLDGYASVAADGSIESGIDSTAPDEAPEGDEMGADEAVPPGDASTQDVAARDAAVHEASMQDGATQDAPVRDGAPDAADSAAAADARDGAQEAGPVATWCTNNVDHATLLCDDFDEGKTDGFLTYPYGEKWNQNQVGGSDGINRTDYAPGSPPFSLNVQTACTGPAPGCQASYTQEQFISPDMQAPHGILFTFAVKIEDFDLSGGDVSLVVVNNGGSWRLSLDYSGGNDPDSDNQFLEGATLDSGANVVTKTVIAWPDFTDPCDGGSGAAEEGGTSVDGGICIGGWVTIQMMVDAVGTTPACAANGGPCVTLTYNGQNAIIGGATVIPINPPPSNVEQIVIGANFIAAPDLSMLLQYDNVKVEALP